MTSFCSSDDPLADGMVDAMQEAGIRASGPNANAALLVSRGFQKSYEEYGIPTAKHEVHSMTLRKQLII